MINGPAAEKKKIHKLLFVKKLHQTKVNERIRVFCYFRIYQYMYRFRSADVYSNGSVFFFPQKLPEN